MWAIFSLAIETALRRGEMVKLEWSHLHLHHGNGYLMLPVANEAHLRPHLGLGIPWLSPEDPPETFEP